MKRTISILGFFCLLILSACNQNYTTSDNQPITEEYEIIQINSGWFNVSYLEPKTYIIEEPQSSQGNVSYFILGDERAIMLDTGTGENPSVNGNKIKHIVNQLTSLSTTLVLSHFHFDHNQNINEFESVAFPDIDLLKQNVSADSIYEFTSEDLFEGSFPSQVKVTEWLPVNADIDLGNKIIQLVSITGHTNESIAIIDKTNKLAFLGDYLYNGSLFIFDNNDLVKYKESVDFLISILDNEYRLFGAHGTPEIQFSKLQKLKDFLVCIENNICQSTAITLWSYPVFLYQYEGMEIVIFQ